jgi:hypothetical protein
MKHEAAEYEILCSRLAGWPALEPDPKAMKAVSISMSQRLRVLTDQAGEDLLEGQFRMISWIWGTVAFGIYAAWPRISELFTEYPFLLIAVTCVGGLACLAPLIILPVLRAGNGDETPVQTLRGGHTPC